MLVKGATVHVLAGPPSEQWCPAEHDGGRDRQPDGCGRPTYPGGHRLPARPVDLPHSSPCGPRLSLAGTGAIHPGGLHRDDVFITHQFCDRRKTAQVTGFADAQKG